MSIPLELRHKRALTQDIPRSQEIVTSSRMDSIEVNGLIDDIPE